MYATCFQLHLFEVKFVQSKLKLNGERRVEKGKIKSYLIHLRVFIQKKKKNYLKSYSAVFSYP